MRLAEDLERNQTRKQQGMTETSVTYTYKQVRARAAEKQEHQIYCTHVARVHVILQKVLNGYLAI